MKTHPNSKSGDIFCFKQVLSSFQMCLIPIGYCSIWHHYHDFLGVLFGPILRNENMFTENTNVNKSQQCNDICNLNYLKYGPIVWYLHCIDNSWSSYCGIFDLFNVFDRFNSFWPVFLIQWQFSSDFRSILNNSKFTLKRKNNLFCYHKKALSFILFNANSRESTVLWPNLLLKCASMLINTYIETFLPNIFHHSCDEIFCPFKVFAFNATRSIKYKCNLSPRI